MISMCGWKIAEVLFERSATLPQTAKMKGFLLRSVDPAAADAGFRQPVCNNSAEWPIAAA